MINVREQKFHADFDVENESSRERKFQGTKVPVNESSKNGEQKFSGKKVPVTMACSSEGYAPLACSD